MNKITLVSIFLSFFLNAQTDSVSDSTIVNMERFNLDWFNYPSFFIGLAIGLLFLYYFFYQSKSIKYTITSSKTKKEEGEPEESWGSFFKTFNEQDEAESLYDKLRRKIHPDRFPNNNVKRDLATKLASELGDNKIHLDRLNEIEQEAIMEGLI